MTAILKFGRYKGRSLPWVALHDPDHLFWMVENNNVFKRNILLRSKAGELERATGVTVGRLTLRIVNIAGVNIMKACGHGDPPRGAQGLRRCPRMV